jgi:hypothetical protein
MQEGVRLRRCLCLALWSAAACTDGTRAPSVPRIEAEVATAARPWTGLEPLEEPDDFRFAVVTDRTGEHREGVFESAMPKVNLLQPAFVMSVGDLIEGYTEDPAQLDREWDEFQAFVARLQMPFFYVPGNHDMSNRVMAEEWRERFGPTFYHFRYKDTLFVALNSELFGMVHDPAEPLPGPETQEQQMAWLQGVLAANADVRWTLLFVHQPLWDKKQVPPDWLRVEDWLAGRPHTVFAGHFHRYTSHVRRGNNYITLATTGGGSLMRGLMFGEFDHVALVTMKRQGPVIANLLLDGIQDKDVRTTATRGVAEQLERAVTGAPIAAVRDPFRRGTARFSIANRGAVPLTVEGRVEAGRHLRAAVERVAREIAPGATADVAIDVEAAERVPLAALAPGRVHWTLRSSAADGTPVEIAHESLLLPEGRFAIPQLRRAVEVDGALGDWDALPLAVEAPVQVDGQEHHSGPADASFRLGLAWDAQALYLAVDAVDDALLLSSEKTWREQDHLAFSIDARPDPARSENEDTDAALRGTMRLLFLPNAAPVEPRLDPITKLFLGGLPEGTRVASQRSAKGYTAEVAIPARALDERAGEPWTQLRINVSQYDFDPGEPDHSVIWFRPNRFGSLGVQGSGTFERKE